MTTVLERIKEQIDAAKDDLASYGPPTIIWVDRCKRTAEELVPWLQGSAENLIEYVEGVLNAPKTIRKMWSEIKDHVDLPATRIKAFEDLLELDEAVSRSLNGQVISSILTKRLSDTAPPQLKLTPNVGNDFPDLYVRCGGEWDYAGLPRRKDTGKDGGSKNTGPHSSGTHSDLSECRTGSR